VNDAIAKTEMVYCMGYDCSNDSRFTTGVTYHRLPKDKELCSQWLAKISRENPTISKNSVVCSDHFTPECFERNLKAELLGTKPKATLKSNAIPTIFSHIPIKKPRLSSEKRQLEREKKEVRLIFTFQSCETCNMQISISMNITTDI